MNCSSCGAALAEDQRYCLNCGQRRGDARVDFRRHLEDRGVATQEPAEPSNGSGPPAAIEPVAQTPPPEKPQRDYAPLAAAGGIAVLGIMLLIGVLIGRGSGGEEQTAAPQVVTVPAAESATGSARAVTPSGGGEGGGKATAKSSGGKPAKNDNVVSGGSADTGNAPVASDEQLEALQGKTGEEYAKESAKLPDEIATPGAPPPEDNKAPGGGSGGVTLE